MAGAMLFEYNRYPAATRVVLVGCWTLLGAIGVGLITIAPYEQSFVIASVGIATAIAGLFFAYRLSRSGRVEVSAGSVTVHGMIRTATLPRSSIDRFTIVKGMNSYDELAEALGVRTKNGQVIVFPDFRTDTGTDQMSVSSLAEQLNRLVAA